MPSWTEVPIFTDAALKEGSSVSGSVSSAQASRFYSIDLFFDQPEAAGLRINEALAAATDPTILVYIEGSDITDAFTGEAASEEQVERMRENLKYIVDSNNEKREI